jgi:hypothetical protein
MNVVASEVVKRRFKTTEMGRVPGLFNVIFGVRTQRFNPQMTS